MTDLRTLVETAARGGWAAAAGTLDSIRDQAKSLGWTEVPTRRGEPAVAVLRPLTREDAHPHSLSASCGLGEQPLHTDGAHLSDPPDIVVLACEQGSSTPTLLWCPPTGAGSTGFPWDAARHGLFLVRNGRDSFYSPAVTGSRYRFDPGCMTPCDLRARKVADYFADQLAGATAHEWAPGARLLVVDNRRSLHARAALDPADEERSLTRVAFHIGRTS